jgi:hypothetical protein
MEQRAEWIGCSGVHARVKIAVGVGSVEEVWRTTERRQQRRQHHRTALFFVGPSRLYSFLILLISHSILHIVL